MSRNLCDFLFNVLTIRQGNKGAVAIRLTYRPFPTSSAPTPVPIILTFVDSHLAAFEDHVDRRNTDFYDISRRLTFGPCTEYVKGRSGEGLDMVDIYASDFLLWLVGRFIRHRTYPVPYDLNTGR